MTNSQQYVVRTLLGLFLLLPAVVLCAGLYLFPALSTLDKSRMDYNLFRPEQSERVGMENYDQLVDDEVFSQALGYTLRLTIIRMGIVAVAPLLVGVLVGLQGRQGRAVNRLLLTLIAVFVSPVVFGLMMRIFLGRTWDFERFEPSPLGEIPDWLALFDAVGARNVVNLTDAILTLGLAVVVGGAAYAAAMRGKQAGYDPALAFIGIWIVGVLLAAASAAQTLTLPLNLTNGGPGRSTITLPLMIYLEGFLNLRLGYAAAQAAFLIVPTAIIGLLLWAILTFTRLRIIFLAAEPPAKAINGLSLLSLPLIGLLGLPVLGLIVWGFWLVLSNGGFERGSEMLDLNTTLPNTILTPWLAIWLVQLPVAYGAGFALGYLRPLGYWGASFLFLPFLVFGLLPTEALMLDWFETMQEQELLNTTTALAYPWLFGALSLLIFKLFFDGTHDSYQQARAEGQSAAQAFIAKVFLLSLGVFLLVGAALSFLSMHSFTWPRIVTLDPDYFTIPLQLQMISGQFAIEYLSWSGGAMLFSGLVAVIFLVVFTPLHVFFVDKLAILAGSAPPAPPTAAETPSPTPDDTETPAQEKESAP